MGVSSPLHPTTSAPREHEFHEALRRRHEHHLHPSAAVRSRRARQAALLLLPLLLAVGSYQFAQQRGRARLAERDAGQRATLATHQQAVAALEAQLMKEERVARRNLAEIQSLRARVDATSSERNRARSTEASLRGELESAEAQLLQLRQKLAELNSMDDARAAEMEELSAQQKSAVERRDLLLLQIREATARLDEARAAHASEQELLAQRRNRS